MKTVLITGGSRGIGEATVKKFASENYSVILNYNRSEEKAIRLRDNLRQQGYDVHLFRADVSNSTQVAEMFRFVRLFKHLDVLVNNAGIALTKLFQDTSEEDYDSVMDINAKGAFLCSREAVKLFIAQKYGSIVNVSSIWGIRGASCECAYSMSKHALIGLTKSLSLELAPSNVHVNCVCPPIVKTDMCKSLSSLEIDDFCRENDVGVFLPEQIAEDIFSLATCGKTGLILSK